MNSQLRLKSNINLQSLAFNGVRFSPWGFGVKVLQASLITLELKMGAKANNNHLS